MYKIIGLESQLILEPYYLSMLQFLQEESILIFSTNSIIHKIYVGT